MSRFHALKVRWLEARRERFRQRFGAASGDEARRFNRLDDAVTAYEAYLKRRPHDLGVQLRLVGVLRDAGRVHEAVARLERLAQARPDKLKIRLALAEALDESGAVERARDVYADVVRKEPLNAPARDALSRIVQALTVGDAAPPVPPLMQGGHTSHVRILIDAIGASQASLMDTVRSVEATSDVSWRLSITGYVGDLPKQVTNRLQDDEAGRGGESVAELYVRAGTVLKENALSWLLWAIRLGAIAAYADHEGPEGEPMLQSAPHRLDLTTNPSPPGLIMFAPDFRGREGDGVANLACAFAEGAVMHVPLILSRSDGRPASGMAVETGAPGHDRLLVIIPTRDAVDELRVMVSSLASLAAQPDKFDVIVIDNGSQPPLTTASLETCGAVTLSVVRVDEPFNWARLNNRACAGQTQPIILFANNDMEMLTSGWDDRLRALLSVENVGVVGARLLYPNGLLQHGGIVMGGLNGEPLHDGWRVEENQRGPLDRWVRLRPATAVTGGFMAVRRTVFDAVGGFDEVELPISCSDVDLCLKAGALGWTVLYAPEIEVRHHESLTRGHAGDDAARLSAEKEMRVLLKRWDARAAYDPTRNPQWETRGVRLYAGRRPLATDQVIDWALKTASRPGRTGRQANTPTLA
ncbi:N-acetylglucosaminyl-diphospho-decaprenol L-rhamnosyltransferase [compost metagenome]